jgi:hypothetical protein
MPIYTATDSVDDWSTATPAGTDSPDELDDALREIKTVTKAVVKNAHMPKGGLRSAIVYHAATTAQASGVINTWNRRTLSTKVDPTSLIAAGTHVNSWKPIAGYYLCRYWGVGHKLDSHCVRLAEATGAASSAFIGASGEHVGSIMFSNNAEASNTISIGESILQADGIKSYCLDHIHNVANLTDGYGRAVTAGAFAAQFTQPPKFAQIEFLFLGVTLA